MGKNTDIEAKAIRLVMDYEKNNEPIDCHKERNGYDIKCRDKIIEVKGSTEAKIPFVTLSQSNIKAFENHENYYVYVVYDLNKNSKLLIVDKSFIEENKRKKNSLEIPLRKAQYENSISLK